MIIKDDLKLFKIQFSTDNTSHLLALFLENGFMVYKSKQEPKEYYVKATVPELSRLNLLNNVEIVNVLEVNLVEVLKPTSVMGRWAYSSLLTKSR